MRCRRPGYGRGVCTVTIDSVGGIGPGPASISVLGTIADCEVFEGGSVRVRLACGSEDNVIGEQTVTPDAAGAWHASFDNNPDGDCRCDGDVFVTATCVSDPTCSTSVAQPLVCIECPLIEPPDDDAGTPTIVVECNPDGTADVTITQKVTNVTSSIKNVQMQCGPDGAHVSGGLSGVLPGQTILMSMTCRYPTPHAPLPVRVTVFTGTPPFELLACPPLEIPLPALQPCEAQCPQILNVAVDIRDCVVDPDDGIEKREVVFTATVVPAMPMGVNYLWGFGDGTPSEGDNVFPIPLWSHLYAAKPVVPPELCLIGPGDCITCYQIPLSAFDTFEACACPVIMDIEVQIGDCVVDPDDGITKREVTFLPTVSPPEPTSHIWTFGDGSTPESGGMGQLGDKVHLYESAPTTEPQLCIDGPVPCGQRCATVPLSEFATFEPCDGSSTDPGDEGLGCAALRWTAAVLGAIGLLALLLALCLPPPASTILGITGVVSLFLAGLLAVLYSLFCPDKQCGWQLLLSAQTFLGAGAGAVILSACCSWLAFAGVILLIAGFSAIFLWWSTCNKTSCDVAGEITVVIMGLIVPLGGLLASVPGLSACISLAGFGVISFIFGPIATIAAACQLNQSP